MRVAVIGTFFGRHENSFPILHRLVTSTRQPNECWLMCETDRDAAVLDEAYRELYDLELLDAWPKWLRLEICPTPRDADGRYAVIPYSNKINTALDRTGCDAIVYLDNNSMPAPDKYEIMAAGLEQRPWCGAVYCTQKRTGFSPTVALADGVVHDGYCAVNYTQVMHRLTADRWTLDMRHADPDLADALFWRSLHATLGPFYPVGGDRVLDEHHIPSPTAAGLKEAA